MNMVLILLSIFVISILFFFILSKKIMSHKKIKRRLTQLTWTNRNDVDVEEDSKKQQSYLKETITGIAKIFKGITFSKRLERLLEESGSLLRPEEFLLFQILCAIGVGILSFILDLPLLILFFFVMGGLFLPNLYLISKRKKRLSILSYQLIETLGMMANSLRAGFSFMQAMQLVGKELPDPLGPEFERAVREVGLGKPIEEVFESLVHRLPNKELEVVIRAILAQRKSGGNLAELLETMEETIRGRIRILEELNTLTAQGRMSAWVITLIPPGLAVYLYLVNPDYFKPMLNHPLGVLMLSIGSISILLGWLLIQKIIKIEV